MGRKRRVEPVQKNEWKAWSRWGCNHCHVKQPAGTDVWEAQTKEVEKKYGFYLCDDCAKKILEEYRNAEEENGDRK